VLPAALHLFEGGRVHGVTIGDHLVEMPVLGLDDLVGGLTSVLVVAWPAELLACHRFHQLTAFFSGIAILISTYGHRRLGVFCKQRCRTSVARCSV
jgi:hypothetical protein